MYTYFEEKDASAIFINPSTSFSAASLCWLTMWSSHLLRMRIINRQRDNSSVTAAALSCLRSLLSSFIFCKINGDRKSQELHLSTCIQLRMTKHPSWKSWILDIYSGCDTIASILRKLKATTDFKYSPLFIKKFHPAAHGFSQIQDFWSQRMNEFESISLINALQVFWMLMTKDTYFPIVSL